MKGLMIILVLISICSKVFGVSYVGPKVIVNTKWGKRNGQVGGVRNGFSFVAPTYYKIHHNGNIYLYDIENKRIVIFNKTGKFIKNIKLFKFSNLVNYVTRLAIDNQGHIVFTDKYGELKKINQFTQDEIFNIDLETDEIRKLYYLNNNLIVNLSKDSFVFNAYGKRIPNSIFFRRKMISGKYKIIKCIASRGVFFDKKGNKYKINFRSYKRFLYKQYKNKFTKKKLKKIMTSPNEDLNGRTFSNIGHDKFGNTYWVMDHTKVFVFDKGGLFVYKLNLKKIKEIKDHEQDFLGVGGNWFAVDLDGNIYRKLFKKSNFEIVKYERRKKNL